MGKERKGGKVKEEQGKKDGKREGGRGKEERERGEKR